MKKTTQIQPAILAPNGARAAAALYWVDDQYLFHATGEQGEQVKFLSAATLREAFAKEPIDLGWLPAGVQRAGISSRGSWMVRWHAPAVYTIHIEGRKTPLRVPMPALVWFGQRKSYYLWAMRGKVFEPDGRLYCAPLSNVSAATGLVCFGSNAHPDVAKGGFEPAWRIFWEAPFNEDHDKGKSKAHPESILAQLRACAGARVWPAEDLVRMDFTLNAAIARLTRQSQGGDQWED